MHEWFFDDWQAGRSAFSVRPSFGSTEVSAEQDDFVGIKCLAGL
jgi:hypothetical protein